MSPLVYKIIVYTVEALISGIFLLNLLKTKVPKILHLVIWCLTVIVSLFVTSEFSIIRIIIISVLEIIFTVFIYEDKLLSKLRYFVLKECILIASMAVSFVSYRLLTADKIIATLSLYSDMRDRTLLYLLTFSVIVSIAFQLVKRPMCVETPWIVGTQAVIGVGEIGLFLALVSGGGEIVNGVNAYLTVISTVFMIAANVSIGMLAPYLLQKISHSTNMDHGQELSNMEYKYYEMSVENDKKLMGIKHDISNHIQTIYSLLRNGENQRGMELIEELRSRYALIEQIVYCNNPVVNIILSNKKQDAIKKNIEMHIRVKEDLDDLPITDFDLSTVICNLIDNAIRGAVCSEQSYPRLIVEILQKNQYLVIRVLNSCKVSMNIESTDRIETTKAKSQSHGIGMPIVSGIAQKYRGDFVVSAQNGLFTATVVMSVKE